MDDIDTYDSWISENHFFPISISRKIAKPYPKLDDRIYNDDTDE